MNVYCIDVQVREKEKDFQPQPILVENKCLFTTQAPTRMYGVHAVQLALGDHNTMINGNSRWKYHHWNPKNLSLQSIISKCINQFQLSFLVSESLQLSICCLFHGCLSFVPRKLGDTLTSVPTPGWLGMPGWVRRSTCFAAEMRYCNKRFAELGLGKLRQQDWDDGSSSGT